MRKTCLLIAAAIAAAPAAAKPLREQSPVPQDLLAGLGFDAVNEAAIAAARAHPLGTLQNPVRVGGPDGERAYLSRLRCADGSAPRIGAKDSAGVGAFGSIVGAFPLDCGAVRPGKISVIMDMYHSEHREDRAPPGFQLAGR